MIGKGQRNKNSKTFAFQDT